MPPGTTLPRGAPPRGHSDPPAQRTEAEQGPAGPGMLKWDDSKDLSGTRIFAQAAPGRGACREGSSLKVRSEGWI